MRESRDERFTRLIRKASGEVEIRSRLVSFLYELMRDEVTPGVVARVLKNSLDPDVRFCNGWLARYAEWVAKQLLYTPKPRREWSKARLRAHREGVKKYWAEKKTKKPVPTKRRKKA